MQQYATLALLCLLLSQCAGPSPQAPQPAGAITQIAVGTYTRKEGHVDGKASGIYLLSLDEATGQLSQLSRTEGPANPSFLVPSPNGRYLYAVQETGPDVDSTGRVHAYAVSPSGELERLNDVSSHHFAPCHLSVSPNGQQVFVANYVGGTIAVLPVKNDGGLLEASDVHRLQGSGPHSRQDSSHPHSANVSPDGRFLYVPDLGTDKIMIYRTDREAGRLTPADMPFVTLPPSSGPRHFAIHPTQGHAFVVNELSATVTVLARDAESGSLRIQQHISTLPEGWSGSNLCADLHVSPDGRFLYASNRGHDSIAIFAIDPAEGTLRPLGHEGVRGQVPRNFMISPSGQYLCVANQNTDNVVVFRRDVETGLLSFTSELSVPTPVCLKAF